MGRKVPGPPPGIERGFIPRAFGNRDDKEPVLIWIRTPTERERREVAAACETSIRLGKDGEAPSRIEVDLRRTLEWQRLAVTRFVTRVEHYTAASGEPIASGGELAEHGETAFVAEAAREIIEATELGDLGKGASGGWSGSTRAGTPPSDGTATGAGRVVSTSSAGAA